LLQRTTTDKIEAARNALVEERAKTDPPVTDQDDRSTHWIAPIPANQVRSSVGIEIKHVLHAGDVFGMLAAAAFLRPRVIVGHDELDAFEAAILQRLKEILPA
jgi:hypothetical protein